MNPRVEQVWQDATKAKQYGDSWADQQQFLQDFAQQVVGETITAILATDCRDFTYTTFDRDRVQGTLERVVNTVRKHWEFR